MCCYTRVCACTVPEALNNTCAVETRLYCLNCQRITTTFLVCASLRCYESESVSIILHHYYRHVVASDYHFSRILLERVSTSARVHAYRFPIAILASQISNTKCCSSVGSLEFVCSIQSDPTVRKCYEHSHPDESKSPLHSYTGSFLTLKFLHLLDVRIVPSASAIN